MAIRAPDGANNDDNNDNNDNAASGLRPGWVDPRGCAGSKV